MGCRRLLIGLVNAALFVTTSCRAEFGSFGGGGSGASGASGSDQDPPDPGGGGAVASGGGQAGGSAEDCTSGADEDHDGFVDCADLGDCGGHLCAPLPASSDWEGPLVLHAPDTSACAPGWEIWQESGMRLENEAGVCGCSCAPASGQGCIAQVLLDCNGLDELSVGAGPCQSTTKSATTFAAQLRPTGGWCTAAATTETPSYEPRLLCAAPQGQGCADGSFCVRPLPPPSSPPAPPNMGGVICFARPGVHACSASTYSDRHLVFEEAPGSLACIGTCTCGPPSGGECSGSVTLHADGTCAAPLGTTSQACVPLNGMTVGSVQYNAAAIELPGSCGPSARALDVAAGVHTLCCAKSL